MIASDLGCYACPADRGSLVYDYQFERLYVEPSGPLGGKAPTLGVFNHFFTLIASNDYYTIRKSPGGIEVFDSKNTNIQRIDSINSG
jgi:hypothetical protein